MIINIFLFGEEKIRKVLIKSTTGKGFDNLNSNIDIFSEDNLELFEEYKGIINNVINLEKAFGEASMLDYEKHIPMENYSGEDHQMTHNINLYSLPCNPFRQRTHIYKR